MLQKTVIYMFIKVYQEPDSVCVCVAGVPTVVCHTVLLTY